MRSIVSGGLEEERTCTLFRPSVFAALQARNFRPNSATLHGTILRLAAPNDGSFLPSHSQNFC